MHRRQYLMRAGVSAGAVTTLAGCLGELTDSDDGTGSEGADRTGERALDRATGRLNEAALALQVDDSIDDPEAIDFDPAVPNDLIDEARDYLDTAAAELDEDHQSDVEGLRTYADILEGLVVVTDTVTDETLADDVDAVSAVIDGDGNHEDASDTLDDRTARLETAQTRYDAAAADFDSFEQERFEALARIDYTDLEDGITTLGDVLDSFRTLSAGFESMLEGYDALEQGQSAVDDEDYEQARPLFADAESAFETATTTFDDEEPPNGLVSYFETARCQSAHLTAAAVAFEESAAAAAAGDPLTAAEYREAGDRDLEAARDCSQ
ncbi:hypothetical protein [Natronorubrum sulfidifaciens]|uniref:Uncharacterized protein n=1 Tax=Natronorubrum sulfidifaciens JCM 14089 TaxID=1230460 RepID=L9WB37_9EURY|nr:hypothetical protein [Natronorubrum sulfidifaciens]ELY46715.1 hypothetical protein C495_06393 [Natronorubrum sulfidifaciens JCM 14089]